jgi:hypothetical protein
MPPGVGGIVCGVGVAAASDSPALVGSTIGAGGLNFRVRDGSGCGPAAVATVTFVSTVSTVSTVSALARCGVWGWVVGCESECEHVVTTWVVVGVWLWCVKSSAY